MPGNYNLPQRRLVSQEESSMVQRANVPRSRFSGRKTRIAAYRQGIVYPFHIDEVLPGDHFKYRIEGYFRMATALFPIFSNLRIDTFAFFVPMRILWANFKRFMGEQPTGPADSIAFTIPQIVSPAGGFAQFDIYDHFGIPVSGQITAGQTITVNALPFRAYNLIWNEMFRDQNLQNALPFSTGDGPDAEVSYRVQRRGKGHDYFTTCLPAPQKFTAPTVPLGGLATVLGLGVPQADQSATAGPLNVRESTGFVEAYAFYRDTTTPKSHIMEMTADGGIPAVFADLSTATGVSINVLRQAWLVQSMLERDARSGTRYPEFVFAHFGVRTPDFRVQRPEYIGGGSSALQISPIPQTTPTGGGGLGALGGVGIATGEHRGSYAATEHGYIIWLIQIRSELAYQQGTHPLWTRQVRTDLAIPDLAGLGEQAVLRREIFTNGVDADDLLVFGYQERNHEYRAMWSDVVGIMRSQAVGTLHAWHLAQSFSPAPTLNSTFIVDEAPMDRVLAAGSAAINQQIIADIVIARDVARPLPMFGTPASIGRF